MTTLEIIARTKPVIKETGECSTCRWKTIIQERIEANPNYVPYGSAKKCVDNKIYKNCAGYMPITP